MSEFTFGKSYLPDDVFTDTDALNGLADTFPDIALGTGLLSDGYEFYEGTSVPDGIVTAEDGFSFTSMGDISHVTKSAALNDLSWLEAEPSFVTMDLGQNSIPALEEAWGRDPSPPRKTFINSIDRDHARYNASLSETTKKTKTNIAPHVRSARRRLASGQDTETTLNRFVLETGVKDKHVLAELRGDAGLIGKVFIRASDYPDCHKGAWTSEVKVASSLAPFIIQKKACGGCTHAQQGRCAVFKKKLVASVPWKTALQEFKPRFASMRVEIPNGLPAKDALRVAFSTAPAAPQKREHWQTHNELADRIDLRTAEEHLSKPREVTTIKMVNAKDVQRESVKAQIGRWVTAGLLTASQADGLITNMTNPAKTASQAVQLIKLVKVAQYSGGVHHNVEATTQDVKAYLEACARRKDKAAKNVNEYLQSKEAVWVRQVQKKAQQLSTSIKNGLRGRALVAALVAYPKKELSLIAEVLEPTIKHYDALNEPVTASYSGITNNSNKHLMRMSAKDALAYLKTKNPVDPIVKTNFQAVQVRQRLANHLRMWVDNGILRSEDKDLLLESKAAPEEVMKAAAHMMQLTKVSAYSGVENLVDWRPSGSEVTMTQALNSLRAAGARRAALNESLKGYVSDKVARDQVAKVVSAVESGLRGKHLITLMDKVITSSVKKEVMAALQPVFTKTGALSDVSTPTKVYSAAVLETAAPINSQRGDSPVSKREVVGMLRWVGQRMNEGSVGVQLTDQIKAKFGPRLLTAGSKYVDASRKKHEALAGHLYVDPVPYASKTGTAGCEQAAPTLHKVAAKHVLAMPRCASCTKKSALMDGTEKCMVFNRKLTASPPVEDVSSYKKTVLSSVRPVACETPSYEYDAGEFLLSSPSNIEVGETPEPEMLDDISLGGMYL